METDDKPTRGRILFVDDEQRVLTSMRATFRRDYDVLLANSGQEALEVLRDHDIDVIISDQRMPGMTGVEVLRQVRTLAPRAMRILLTGYADLKAIEASINEGEVFRYLTKPCPTELLKEAISLAVDAARTSPTPSVVHKPASAAAPAMRAAPASPAATASDEFELIEIVPAGVKSQAPPRVAAIREALPARPDPSQAVEAVQTPVEVLSTKPAPVVSKPEQPPASVQPALKTAAAAPARHDAAVRPPEAPAAVAPVAARTAPASSALRTVPRRPTRREVREIELLALSTDGKMNAVIESAIGGSHRLHTAHTVEEAVAVLETNPVGVLVTDIAVRQEEIHQLTAELKRHVPELVTIVASDRSDAQLLIDLINFGQIFRFLLKPLHAGQCRLAIEAAIGRHREMALDPALARRHAVAVRARPAPAGVVGHVLDRVRRLRERLFTAGGVV